MAKTKEDDIIEAMRNEFIKKELQILRDNNLKLGHLGLAKETAKDADILGELFDRMYEPKLREAIRLTAASGGKEK